MSIRRAFVSLAATLFLIGWAAAQGRFSVTESDLPEMKLNHYFTPDKKSHARDFEWTFTKTGFTIKKGTGPIPRHLLDQLLPPGSDADEVTGGWTLKGGKLELTGVKAGGKDGRKGVSLPIFKTAPTVVRICDPEQYVFGVGR